MPLYEMYCTECKKKYMIKQSIHNELPTECKYCKGKVKQLLNNKRIQSCCGDALISRCEGLAKSDRERIEKGDQKAIEDLAGTKQNKLKQ